ncbi:MAG: dephospho-CoA kinase, partial [Candidatus Diapherotrites archaeon]|nr:dephospho-CoA kinase [Candidatus Diapherotrites archaeon]
MRLIALTGSICSGKSTVLRFFRQQGIATVDCDA